MRIWLEQHPSAELWLTLATAATLMLLLSLGMSWRTTNPWPRQAIALWTSLALGAWIGLAARNEWELAGSLPLVLALGAAAIACGLMMGLPAVWKKMTHQRRIARARQTVGRVGKAYRTIDGLTGAGIVEVDGLGRFPARSDAPVTLAAFTRVRILDADAQGQLRVRSAAEDEI